MITYRSFQRVIKALSVAGTADAGKAMVEF